VTWYVPENGAYPRYSLSGVVVFRVTLVGDRGVSDQELLAPARERRGAD
jgi:hypothetical protein